MCNFPVRVFHHCWFYYGCQNFEIFYRCPCESGISPCPDIITSEPARFDDMEDGLCWQCEEKNEKVPEALPERPTTPAGQHASDTVFVDNWTILGADTGESIDGLGGAMRTYGALTRKDPAEEAREAIREAVESLVVEGKMVLYLDTTAAQVVASVGAGHVAAGQNDIDMDVEYAKLVAELADMDTTE